MPKKARIISGFELKLYNLISENQDYSLSISLFVRQINVI